VRERCPAGSAALLLVLMLVLAAEGPGGGGVDGVGGPGGGERGVMEWSDHSAEKEKRRD
jgi:hypothetical protein